MRSKAVKHMFFWKYFAVPFVIVCWVTPLIGWFTLWLLRPYWWRMSFCEPGESYEEASMAMFGEVRMHCPPPSPRHPLYNWAMKFPVSAEDPVLVLGPYR